MDEFEAADVKVLHGMQAPGMRAEICTVRWSEQRAVPVKSSSYCFSYILKVGMNAEPPIVQLLGSRRYLNYGWVWFAPPETPLMIKRAPESVTALILRIDPAHFCETTRLAGEWHNERSVLRFNIDGAVAFQTLDALAMELASPDPAAETMIAALATVFLVQFARIVRRANDAHRKGGLSDWQHLRIRQIVSRQPANKVTVEALAQACHISPRHLVRSFRQSVGMTVHQYVEQVRIERGKTLLDSTELSAEAIAEMVGFANSSHMGLSFRKRLGLTPGDYRRRFRQASS